MSVAKKLGVFIRGIFRVSHVEPLHYLLHFRVVTGRRAEKRLTGQLRWCGTLFLFVTERQDEFWNYASAYIAVM